MDDQLREKFFQALDDGDVDKDAVTEELSTIAGRYNERKRHYHNLVHVTRLLALCDELGICDPDIMLAVIYHDIIYRPGSLKNEEKSAAYALESLGRLGVNPDRMGQVCEMILATANHLIPQDNPLTQTLLDLDMSILGSPREDYQAYADGVRKEYPWLPGVVFEKKRRQFLERVLAEEYIFHTDLFREKYEGSARANIEWELGL
jgi:predicted metal-dependent HD superfamily phosphohydrolase